ncbi:hypothetical protein U1Q18_045658 [Sarracenia purpurea var. burkii]
MEQDKAETRLKDFRSRNKHSENSQYGREAKEDINARVVPTVTTGVEGSGPKAGSPSERYSVNQSGTNSDEEYDEALEIEEEELKIRQALHDKAMAD